MSKTESDGHDREQQLNAIIHRYYADLENGGTPNPSELLNAFPAFAEALSEFFAGIALLASDKSGAELTRTLYGAGGDAEVHNSSIIEAPARNFGEYELLEELGSGGMGVVFKARQRLPGTPQVFSHDSVVTMSDKSEMRFTSTPLGLALPPWGGNSLSEGQQENCGSAT